MRLSLSTWTECTVRFSRSQGFRTACASYLNTTNRKFSPVEVQKSTRGESQCLTQVPDEEALPLIYDLLKEEGLVMGGSTGINIGGERRFEEASDQVFPCRPLRSISALVFPRK